MGAKRWNATTGAWEDYGSFIPADASARLTSLESRTTTLEHGNVGGYAGGSLNIVPTAANTPTSGSVTFPSGRFINAPNAVATGATTVPGTVVTGVGVTGTTTTGCTIYVTRTNTTSTSVVWVAVDG